MTGKNWRRQTADSIVWTRRHNFFFLSFLWYRLPYDDDWIYRNRSNTLNETAIAVIIMTKIIFIMMTHWNNLLFNSNVIICPSFKDPLTFALLAFHRSITATNHGQPQRENLQFVQRLWQFSTRQCQVRVVFCHCLESIWIGEMKRHSKVRENRELRLTMKSHSSIRVFYAQKRENYKRKKKMFSADLSSLLLFFGLAKLKIVPCNGDIVELEAK